MVGDDMYLELNDSNNRIFTNHDEQGRYCIQLSFEFENWEYRLMDFISFHKSNNIKYEINVEKERLEHAKSIYKNTIFNGLIREYESKVLVHSTTPKSWMEIMKSMKIKSWNNATNDGDLVEDMPIGVQLKDPQDFRNYVMLGGFNHNNEIVVMCKEYGKLVFDENKTYNPGARIYIDAAKLAKDGLLLRDGIHLKVKDEIDLSEYMIDVVTPSDFNEEQFTPKKFSKMADNLFYSRNTDK